MSNSSRSTHRLTPFAYGFRPFFLAAIAYGLIGIAAWMVMRSIGGMPLRNLPPQLWHAHEMLFGFICAAIAGFLLTAVPSWTGGRGFAGWPLMVLSALWLAGRIAFAFAGHLPVWVVAVAELTFFPALASLIAFPLLRARNRNTPLLAVIGMLWFADATFMCALARGELALATNTLHVGIDVVLLLITVIGGRIVPAFTANSLRQRGITVQVRNHRLIDGGVIAAMILVIAIDIAAPLHPAAAIVAGVAAVGHAARLAGWQGSRAMGQPIVWVLHLAYLWLPIGLALKAIHLSTGADWAADWMHALTVGTAATMIVAVLTRASLGHTGRPLVVSKGVAVAYGLLGAAALIRALATTFAGYREWAIWTAAALWVMAFAVVLIVYAPILLGPRADGREG